MSPRPLFLSFLIVLFTSGMTKAAPAQVLENPDSPCPMNIESRVQVHWNNPANFTEITHSPNRTEALRGCWMADLARYLGTHADHYLQEGQTLSISLTDIDLAGDYEPWLGPQMREVRVVRDIYPPRMALDFILRDASDQVVSQGSRVLRDPGFLQGLRNPRYANDSLRYEKKLVDRWLAKEFAFNQRLSAGN